MSTSCYSHKRVDCGEGDVIVMISIRVKLGNCFVGVEVVGRLNDGFRIYCYFKGSFFSCICIDINSCAKVEISTIRRGGNSWEGEC